MTCDACERAAVNPATGRFNAGCTDCNARAIAACRDFFESTAAKTITPAYRTALEAVFGADWKDGHAKVKAWHHKIKAKGVTA